MIALVVAGIGFLWANLIYGLVYRKKSSVSQVGERFPFNVVFAGVAVLLLGAATVVAVSPAATLYGLIGYTFGLAVFVFDLVRYLYCRRAVKLNKMVMSELTEMLNAYKSSTPVDGAVGLDEFKW